MREPRVEFTLATPGGRAPFLTYEPYYGLKEKPFSLSADPRFLYKSRTHAPTFDALRAGIKRREGIIVLTGEPGTGKTTLCRSVLAGLDRKTFCTFVPDPFLSREDLLKMLLIDFGVMSIDDLKSGRLHAASRPELSYPLYDFLRSLIPLQAYAVLILDEAQNLTSQLLEEIRILSDLEGPEKLLQLVLVGQPELRDKLKDPTMRQVDQRVSVRCSLQPLGRDALPGYMAHRLTVAGGGSDRVEFEAEALDLLHSASSGNPRVLNLIADRSLHRGHLDRTWLITPEIVASALVDLGYPAPGPAVRKSVPAPPAASLAVNVPAAPLPPSLPLPETLEHLSAEFLPESSLPEQGGEGPRFLLEQAGDSASIAGPHTRRGDGRLRKAAMLAAACLALAAAGLSLNEWVLRRQELAQPQALPALPTAPARHFGAVAAPVIPPPEFFAPVLP